MSWLRMDDGFSRHPKVTALTHKNRWVWLDILCYCASYNTNGFLPQNIREAVAGATPKLLAECVDLELLDETDEGLQVHDWRVYAPKDPTSAERQRSWRKAHPGTLRGGKWGQTRALVLARDNGICFDCGKTDPNWNADHEPHREDLVAAGLDIYDPDYIVTRCHSCHAKKTRREARERRDTTSDTTSDTRSYNGSDRFVTTRAGTARVPVPSPRDVVSSPAFALGVGEGYLTPWDKLVAACGNEHDTLLKLKRASKGCAEGDIVHALEAASGPRVKDPLAVALSELKKRRTA